MSEAQLERAILELAGLLGWRRAHFRPAQLRSGRWATHMSGDTGFPDLVLVRDGRLLFVELKAERGKASPEQVRWLEVLSGVHGIDVCLWRPADWLSGAVAAYLKGEGPAPGKGAWRAVGRKGRTLAGLPVVGVRGPRGGVREAVLLAGPATVRRRVMG